MTATYPRPPTKPEAQNPCGQRFFGPFGASSSVGSLSGLEEESGRFPTGRRVVFLVRVVCALHLRQSGQVLLLDSHDPARFGVEVEQRLLSRVRPEEGEPPGDGHALMLRAMPVHPDAAAHDS